MKGVLLLLALFGASDQAQTRGKAVSEAEVLKALQQCGVNWEIEVTRAVGDQKVFWWRPKPGALKATIETVENKTIDHRNQDEARLPKCIGRWAKRRGVGVNVDLGSVVY